MELTTINVYAVVYGPDEESTDVLHIAEFNGPRDAVRSAVHYYFEGASAQAYEQGGGNVHFLRDDVDTIPYSIGTSANFVRYEVA